MQSIRVFIDASNDKVAVVELRCFDLVQSLAHLMLNATVYYRESA